MHAKAVDEANFLGTSELISCSAIWSPTICDTTLVTANAGMIAGSWLKYWIKVVAGLFSIGLYSGMLSIAAFQLLGISNLGLVPAPVLNTPLGQHPVHQPHHSGHVLQLQQHRGMHSFLYSLGSRHAPTVQFAASFWLRITRPELRCPYPFPLCLPGMPPRGGRGVRDQRCLHRDLGLAKP